MVGDDQVDRGADSFDKIASEFLRPMEKLIGFHGGASDPFVESSSEHEKEVSDSLCREFARQVEFDMLCYLDLTFYGRDWITKQGKTSLFCWGDAEAGRWTADCYREALWDFIEEYGGLARNNNFMSGLRGEGSDSREVGSYLRYEIADEAKGGVGDDVEGRGRCDDVFYKEIIPYKNGGEIAPSSEGGDGRDVVSIWKGYCRHIERVGRYLCDRFNRPVKAIYAFSIADAEGDPVLQVFFGVSGPGLRRVGAIAKCITLWGLYRFVVPTIKRESAQKSIDIYGRFGHEVGGMASFVFDKCMMNMDTVFDNIGSGSGVQLKKAWRGTQIWELGGEGAQTVPLPREIGSWKVCPVPDMWAPLKVLTFVSLGMTSFLGARFKSGNQKVMDDLRALSVDAGISRRAISRYNSLHYNPFVEMTEYFYTVHKLVHEENLITVDIGDDSKKVSKSFLNGGEADELNLSVAAAFIAALSNAVYHTVQDVYMNRKHESIRIELTEFNGIFRLKITNRNFSGKQGDSTKVGGTEDVLKLCMRAFHDSDTRFQASTNRSDWITEFCFGRPKGA